MAQNQQKPNVVYLYVISFNKLLNLCIFFFQNILQKAVPVPYGNQTSDHHCIMKRFILLVLTQHPEFHSYFCTANNKQTILNQPLQDTRNLKTLIIFPVSCLFSRMKRRNLLIGPWMEIIRYHSFPCQWLFLPSLTVKSYCFSWFFLFFSIPINYLWPAAFFFFFLSFLWTSI